MKYKNYKAHLALLGANIIYGGNFLIAKGLMPNYLQPFALVLLRVVGAGLLFWIIKLFVKEKIEKKTYYYLLFVGYLECRLICFSFFMG